MRGPFVPVTMGSPRFHTVEVGSLQVTEAHFSPEAFLPPHVHQRACVAAMLAGSLDGWPMRSVALRVGRVLHGSIHRGPKRQGTPPSP